VCTSISVPAASNFSPAPTSFKVLEGYALTLNCSTAGQFVNTDFTGSTYPTVCQSNSTFPSAFPACVPRPNCGVPTAPSVKSGLVAVNPNATVDASQNATYVCGVSGQITDYGSSYQVPCVAAGARASFKYPTMTWPKCRLPQTCGEAPTPSYNLGLSVKGNNSGFLEFTSVEYVCSNSSLAMYSQDGSVVSSFTVMCVPPGPSFAVSS
jgi:hypothetical protein